MLFGGMGGPSAVPRHNSRPEKWKIQEGVVSANAEIQQFN